MRKCNRCGEPTIKNRTRCAVCLRYNADWMRKNRTYVSKSGPALASRAVKAMIESIERFLEAA